LIKINKIKRTSIEVPKIQQINPKFILLIILEFLSLRKILSYMAGLLTLDHPNIFPSQFPSGYKIFVPITAAGAVVDFHYIPY